MAYLENSICIIVLLLLLLTSSIWANKSDQRVPTSQKRHIVGAPTPSPPTPYGQRGKWTLIFHDEFNESSLNKSVWHTCFIWWNAVCSLPSNNELQLYNAADVLVDNGLLRLRAQKRPMGEWEGRSYKYSSGMVSTGGFKGADQQPKFAFQYGYVESRLKIPKGQGFWPAFWMLPASYAPLSRPEIDIMEILGHTPDTYYMHIHWRKADGSPGSAGQSWTGSDFSANWHIFALNWSSQAIVWYIDGIERWRYTDPAIIPAEPMYLLFNLAVGGNWPGPPNDQTVFPSYLEIDYVRVWQKLE